MKRNAAISTACHGLAASLVVASLFGTAAAQTPEQTRTVKQDPGKIVYWVLPGPRKLDPAAFGTPDDPKALLMPRIKEAREGQYPPTVPDLLMKVPFLVGLPMKARTTASDGSWVLQAPNPFSDKARIVSGSFNAELEDYVDEDQPGPPDETPDKASMTAEFKDPAGNEYRVELAMVVQPPLPGYETQGGVMIDSEHHGSTGTGSPLMPEVKTYAAFWGVGMISVNGKPAGKRMIHLMTTEPVRDRDYHLVFQDQLPLAPEERQFRDQDHHTHLVVLPIEPRPNGPVFAPAPTAFKLPNGMMQPFMHIMFEQDEIVGED
ncbi:MAG TPA: hypothetical protein VE175_05070 [Woeseiaceae bacterium]|nr:hypothetical protein [Woeseiaceae bacterium]